MWENFESYSTFFILITLFYMMLTITSFLKRFIVWPHNIRKKYGPGWAVVTGGSDGIGLGFCQQLAKDGFNICIIGRNKDKIEKVCSSLALINPKIQTKFVLADFSQSLSVQGFFDKIVKELDGIEVSILVNNVGIMLDTGQYIGHNPNKIKDQITINIFPIAILTRLLLPNLISRYETKKKRSLVINLSSFISDYAAQQSANYSSTKLFDDFVSRSVGYENKDKVDFLSVRPALVTTPLTRNTSSLMHVNKNQCARGALRMAGKSQYTYGHWWHEFQAFVSLQFDPQVRNLIVSKSQEKMGKIYRQIDSQTK